MSKPVRPAIQEATLSVLIRAMQTGDVPHVLRIQAQAYGTEFLEPESVLHERQRVAPLTSWVAVERSHVDDHVGDCAGDRAGEVLAYLVGYRTELNCITRLHSVFKPQQTGRCLYLHDLAVSSGASGRGIGPALVAHALDQARGMGCTHSALVSVQGSQPFWLRRGYAPRDVCDADAQAALQSYGAGAVYMTRIL